MRCLCREMSEKIDYKALTGFYVRQKGDRTQMTEKNKVRLGVQKLLLIKTDLERCPYKESAMMMLCIF